MTGCGAGGSPAESSEGDDGSAASSGAVGVEVKLEPVGVSDTSGTVSLVPADGGTEVRLSVRGVPDPGAVYIGAIYRGRCPGEAGATEGGAVRWEGNAVYRFAHGDEHAPDDEGIVQTLTSVEPGPGGEGESVTPLPDRVGGLLSGGPRYVDVHGESGDALACADLPDEHSSGA